MTFTEYVSFYGLSRSEGLVLRYLADAYRALRQTVPEDARTEELTDLIEWLGELVRQVDSSLLDEWERLRNPGAEIDEVRARRQAAGGHPQRPRVPGAGPQRACSAGSSWPPCAAHDGPGRAGRRGRLERRRAGARRWRTTSPSTTRSAPARPPAARRCCTSRPAPAVWKVRQVFEDPEGDHDWGIDAERRPGRVRRAGRGRGHRHRRRPALTPRPPRSPRLDQLDFQSRSTRLSTSRPAVNCEAI